MSTKVVIIGLVWPEPETTAAGSRMLQLIRLFQECSEEIHFASTASKTEYSYPLEDLGVHTHKIELNDSSFDNWIARIAPGTVVFDRFVTEEQFSWRVRESCPSALRILDTEDLHFLRDSRRKLQLNKKSDSKGQGHEDLVLRELGSLFRSDLSLIISQAEMEVLRNRYRIPEELIHYLPLLFDSEETQAPPSLPSFSERADFMTIGNWKHAPNKDSIKYLKNEIWPIIRSNLPGAKMHVYGAYMPESSRELHDEKQGFLMQGWKESRREAFVEHRVCLAPLRFGAGLKGKLFDAMRFGTPSVTTSLGAEGLYEPNLWSGIVKDQPELFAKAAVEIYSDETAWTEARDRGMSLLRSRFSKEHFSKDFKETLARLSNDLQDHRFKNLTGALLWHHTAQSTKYLSKWIEAKNRR